MVYLIVSIIALVVSVISCVVSVRAYLNTARIKKELEDDYWTKDVTGRTINSKVGKDIISDQKEQDRALGKGKPKPEPASFINLAPEIQNPIDDALKES